MNEKLTPKQIVLAAYPNAVAVKLDAKTVMSAPTWAVLEENTETARVIGENGSATGAWNKAAKSIQERQQTHQIAPNFTATGYTNEEAHNFRKRASAAAQDPYLRIQNGNLSAKDFRAKRLAYRQAKRA